MKKYLLFIFLVLCCLINKAQQKNVWTETKEQKKERLAWWTNDRFGMFIHWGLYSLPARHEWIQMTEQLNQVQYSKYFKHFNPDLCDFKNWARKAKNAGMKYVVITTKHHEGFCLFDSKYTNYKSTNTPIGRDLIKDYVEALHSEGLKVGFYYSLIDWHHPHYTIDKIHPLRPADAKDYKKLNKNRDMNIYREYLHNQVRELLTDYGKIDLLWLDYSFPGVYGKDRDDWDSEKLVNMIRTLQPNIIINDRLDLKEMKNGWDFITPEQFKVDQWPTDKEGKKVPWETCQTFSGSWGYYRDEYTWKNQKQLLVLLIESVSKGGNILLNVGMTGRGTIDPRAKKSLKNIGDWMQVHNRSIYGCTEAPIDFEIPNNCLLTYNPTTNRLYIHLLDYPLQNFKLKNYKNKIAYAQFLHDASEIKMDKPKGTWIENQVGDNDINLILPINKPSVEIPVIELFLNSKK